MSLHRGFFIENQGKMERKRKNLSIFFVYTKILSTFAIAKYNRTQVHKGDDDARNNIGHYLCHFDYIEPETVGSTIANIRQPPNVE